MSDKKLSNAQENLLKLPSECFGRLLSDNTIIRIIAGEMGYKLITNQSWPKETADHEGKTLDQLIDELNHNEGVTPAQRKAMEAGSMFGWGIPLANADNYNDDGSINRDKISPKP